MFKSNLFSQALKEWMDAADAGFVYVSLGTMVKIESFPEETVKGFIRSLGKIAPVRVILKITNSSEIPIELPKNIHALEWTPQNEIMSELTSGNS